MKSTFAKCADFEPYKTRGMLDMEAGDLRIQLRKMAAAAAGCAVEAGGAGDRSPCFG